jgi:hypothetical protein
VREHPRGQVLLSLWNVRHRERQCRGHAWLLQRRKVSTAISEECRDTATGAISEPADECGTISIGEDPTLVLDCFHNCYRTRRDGYVSTKRQDGRMTAVLY